MRELVAESHLRVDDLIAPLFVREGIDTPQPIVSLPGVVQHTRSSLRDEVAQLAELGVRSVILFGVPEFKDATGSGAYDPDGVVQVALRDLRADLGDDIVVMADLCVDEYTDHGHCGIVDEHGVVDNDATLDIYAAGGPRPGPSRRARRRAERHDGRTGGGDPVRARRRRVTTTWRSSPMPRSMRARCTDRSATRSTSRSSGAATARDTSRTGATPARRAARSRSTSPRAPTW